MSCVVCFDFSMPSCVLSVSPMFFHQSPSVCQCSHPCIRFIISPVGPPHLFLVLSSVSVYLVSVFPSLLVWSLYLSASVCVHAPFHVHVLCVPLVCLHWILIFGFLMFELNFDVFLCTLSCLLVATFPC